MQWQLIAVVSIAEGRPEFEHGPSCASVIFQELQLRYVLRASTLQTVLCYILVHHLHVRPRVTGGQIEVIRTGCKEKTVPSGPRIFQEVGRLRLVVQPSIEHVATMSLRGQAIAEDLVVAVPIRRVQHSVRLILRATTLHGSVTVDARETAHVREFTLGPVAVLPLGKDTVRVAQVAGEAVREHRLVIAQMSLAP